ncbi:uncharacterized protein LOC143825564 isoform X2 [Paroedura picta]|uniref:uncharacterized protein LOC143825564 isoform X2 n=1 Tax=Paroedura picta TaxID=143630 RepID=UPI0040561B3A
MWQQTRRVLKNKSWPGRATSVREHTGQSKTRRWGRQFSQNDNCSPVYKISFHGGEELEDTPHFVREAAPSLWGSHFYSCVHCPDRRRRSIYNSKMAFHIIGIHRRDDFFSKRIGPLQRQLRNGEYGFFKYSPMFESDFVQISKRGGPVEITNEEQIVTVGISFTSPVLLIPDVLLVARPVCLSESQILRYGSKYSPQRKVNYELSRLFPLSLVKISIHSIDKQQLKFKLASGRKFYLQLCPESYRREYLFDSWIKIIHLLWPPSEIKAAMEKATEARRSRIPLPPKPKAPSPKRPVKSTTAWSELILPKEDKEKRTISKAMFPLSFSMAKFSKSFSRARFPLSLGKAPQALEEEPAERNASYWSPSGEEVRRESSRSARRRPAKESHPSRSKSGQRDTNRKPSKLLSLIRSRSWGSPKKVIQGVRSQSREKRLSAK